MAVCLLLYVLVLLLSGPLQVSTQTAPLKCGMGFKLCTDGSECILYNHVCDGERDCADGSDEADCATVCNQDQFQCAHGKKCVDQAQVCDGVPHCQDRSDELSCTRPSEGCAHLCDMKRCLPSNFLCDGERDCLDGTDETHCEGEEVALDEKKGISTVPTPAGNEVSAPLNSTSTLRKCPLGSKPCRDNTDCVLYNHFCDGEADCKDGSDEVECSSVCETGQFQCAHGKKCIDQAQVCDGTPQCQDRSDELECAKLAEGCAHQCDKSHCVPINFLCDGERDCLDGSDEANCEKVCSTSEFKCASGQCVSASIRCDGHPDCWDRSDEEGCTKPPVCTTKHRCLQSKECLVQEWICDGDQDCKDGTDEKDCPVTAVKCGTFQWSCTSKTMCIPSEWKCDGVKDCDDGSDESECGAATCSSHQFRCGSGECLDTGLVCNGMTNCADGSDEGGSCQTKCLDAARCSQTCYSTPQGAKCGCEAGFLLLEDQVTCIDVDECEAQNPGVCSQLCINTPGSYQCRCITGYVMAADGQHCKITGEPVLLASVQSELFLLGLHSGSLDVLMSSAKKAILSVDYDWKQQKVFWVSLDYDSIMWSSLDQKTKGTFVKGVRSDSVAVDWLGRNLYWIDGVKSEIVAAKLTPTTKLQDHCVILDEDLDQPRSLALLPQKGLMFWTEIGNVAKIERAGMDGMERRAIVNSSLGWPGGVAVDAISNRVFWTDERLKAIGSATLDGGDVKILQMKETTNPFSLAVFNDMVYWSDAKKRTVRAAQKVTGKNSQVLLKRPKQPFGVKIIHPLLQTSIKSPCDKAHCSHVCALAPGLKAVCKCPSDLLLAEDGLTCSTLVNSAFLLVLSLSTVTQIALPPHHAAAELKDWPEHLALQLPNVTEAAMLDYSLQSRTVLLADASLRLFKLSGRRLSPRGQLLHLLGDGVTAAALDWVTQGVYWSSANQPRLQVTSAVGSHTAILLREGLGSLRAIALHPPGGRVCFVNAARDGVAQATVECAHMDGAARAVLWSDAVRPTSLAFSNNGREVYWADEASGAISSILVDGSGYKDFKAGQGLTALALCDDMLLWLTVSDKSRVWYRDEQQQSKLWFEVGTAVVSLKAYSKARQTGSSQCRVNNGGCQHLCLATPGGRTCRCAHDHVSVNGTHCVPEQRCPTGSRPCLDTASCLPRDKFCNGHADCPDHSDENCVVLKGESGALSVALTQPPRSSPHTSPSVQHGHYSTLLNASGDLRVLDAQSCGESLCSGHGDCVQSSGEVSCACSLGYHGDACQDHLLKSNSVIVYGAAALCGGVVLIAVLVAVVKRNTKTRKASQDAKETENMFNLENKVTVPKINSAECATELAEEVVSPVA